MVAEESGERGQEREREGFVCQIKSVHFYHVRGREPATTFKRERGLFTLPLGRSLREESLRAQRRQRKGTCVCVCVGAGVAGLGSL